VLKLARNLTMCRRRHRRRCHGHEDRGWKCPNRNHADATHLDSAFRRHHNLLFQTSEGDERRFRFNTKSWISLVARGIAQASGLLFVQSRRVSYLENRNSSSCPWCSCNGRIRRRDEICIHFHPEHRRIYPQNRHCNNINHLNRLHSRNERSPVGPLSFDMNHNVPDYYT